MPWKGVTVSDHRKQFIEDYQLNYYSVAEFALGGTGVTAYAAQESLPDQTMYPVMTWIEDIRLSLASGPQADVDLLQSFAAERIEEIEALIDKELLVLSQFSTRLHRIRNKCCESRPKWNTPHC